MHRSPIPLLVLAAVISGCAATEVSSPPAVASLTEAPSAEASNPVVERQPLPAGFPVMSGAVVVPMPADDPELIGLWESDQVGSAAYDFYAEALPAAGYPIIGLYPGGGGAVIRFEAPGGRVWQVIAHPSPDGGTMIEVRLDRP
jgi:hypothetical protein